MAVAFDAQATNVVVGAVTSTSGSSSNLTIGGTANALTALLTFGAGTVPVTGLTVTWNSIAMTVIGNTAASDNTTQAFLFGQLGPTTGNHALAVSWTSGAASFTIDAVSWTGVDQGSFATSFPSANVVNLQQTPTVNTADPNSPLVITTLSGDAAVACCSAALSAYGTATTGTLINQDQTNVNYWGGYNLAVGATTSIQFGSNTGGQDPCAHVACRIVATGNVPIITSTVPLGILGFVENEF